MKATQKQRCFTNLYKDEGNAEQTNDLANKAISQDDGDVILKLVKYPSHTTLPLQNKSTAW